MTTPRFICCLFVLFIATGTFSPQVAQTEVPKEPKLFDEFGNISDDDLKLRIDRFFSQFFKNPSMEGYVILYSGKNSPPTEGGRRDMRTRITRTINFRCYDCPRITFVEAGFREEMLTQLYLAPPGGKSPPILSTIPPPPEPKVTFRWSTVSLSCQDLFYLDTEELVLPSVLAAEREEDEREKAELAQRTTGGQRAESRNAKDDHPEEDVETLRDNRNKKLDDLMIDSRFFEALNDRKGSLGVIIWYADDQHYFIGPLHTLIDDSRRRLSAMAGVPLTRTTLIYGGYHDSVQFEFWITNPRNPPPPATPGQRPEPEQ